MVDRLDPGREARVQLVEGADLGGVDLDQELAADGLERPLDLPPAFRSSWLTVEEPRPEHRERPQQLAGDHRGAVVEIGGTGNAAALDPRTQRRLEADRVLGIAPPIATERAGVVVEKAEQVGLVASDHRAVERVPRPQLVRASGLEAAEGDLRPGLAAREARSDEVALDRALVRRPARDGPHELADVRRGPFGALPAEPAGELEDLFRRAGVGVARLGQQGLEAAGAQRPHPAVDRRAGDAHLGPAGAGVATRGEGAHQHAALCL